MAETTADPEIDERTGLKKKKPTGYWLCVMNHFKGCIGSGIFALGFSFKSAGMAFGPPLIVILGLIQLHCQHMLVESGKIVEKSLGRRPDLAETGRGVFEYGPEKVRGMQKTMQIISNTLLTLSQSGVLCIYIVFFANSLKRVAEQHEYYGLSLHMWILIAFPVIFIISSTLGNLKLLAYLSIVANSLVFIGIIITIYLTSIDLPEERTYEWIGEIQTLPMFISIGVLAFTCMQVMPIYDESKYPERVTSVFGVINVSIAIEIILTLVVAVLSYRKYGKDCKGSVTLNFETSIISEIVVILVGISVMLSYALNIYVVIEALFPLMVDKWGPFRYPRLGIFLFRLGYILATFLLAWTLPMLGQLAALKGAIGNTSVSIILPAIFHLVITWENSSKFVKVKDFLILILGIFSMVAGLIAAITNIIEEISNVD